ncbi:MAG: carboxypeptidase-like regulatory domain-containing protein, partial [Planctomycetota bacterium]
ASVDDESSFVAVTDTAGNYDINALPVGSYVISTIAGDRSVGTIDIPSLNAERELDLAVTSTATLRGTLIGSSGFPIGGATINLRPDGQTAASASVQTNAAGEWSFAIFTPGDFTVDAVTSAGFLTPADVTVVAGDDTELNLALSSSGSTTVRLVGTGSDVVARVIISTGTGPTRLAITGEFVDGGGSVTFGDLGVGTYQIDAYYSDGRVGRAVVEIDSGNVPVDVTITDEPSISGQTLDAEGTELPGVQVALLDPGTGELVATGVSALDGLFDIDAVPGTYDVILVADEGVVRYDDVSFDGAQPGLLVTPATQTVTGRLVTGGVGVVSGSVEVRSAAGVLIGIGQADADGNFSIGTLDDLTGATISVSRAGYAEAQLSVPASGGSISDVGDIVLTASALGVPVPITGQAFPSLANDQLSNLAESLGLGNISRTLFGFPDLEVPRLYGNNFPIPSESQIAEDCPACLDEYFRFRGILELERSVQANAIEAVRNYNIEVNNALLTYTARAAKLTAVLSSFYVAAAGAEAAAIANGAVASSPQLTFGADSLIYLMNNGVWAQRLASLGIGTAVLDAVNAVRDVFTAATGPNDQVQQLAGVKNQVSRVKLVFDSILSAISEGVDEAGDLAGAALAGLVSKVTDVITELYDEFFNNKLYDDMQKALQDTVPALEAAETALDQLKRLRPRIDRAWDTLTRCLNENCDDPPDRDEIDRARRWFVRVQRLESFDPNDILGPEGFGDSRFITADETLGYRIRFENEETATAPAQFIRIENPLDQSLDFRTFRLGNIAFADITVEVPDGVPFFQTRVDLIESKGFIVEITAGIDVISGLAFWEFETLDPETGRRPDDPTLGLLPINDGTGIGEGFADYTIRAKADTATGTTIEAEAEIIFDLNAPIVTPVWSNVIDADRPTSIAAAPSNSATTTFDVSWQGGDPVGGSGLASYTVFVSIDGGPYQPWLIGTELTSAPYIGVAGRTYDFVTVARDNAGNSEEIPTTADASVRVAGSSVVDRQVFYNDSSFDGDAGASA